MRRRALHACALALLGLLLVPAGCKQSDSILLIEISGPRREDFVPWWFIATITPGTAEPKAFTIPKTPQAALLPQSFSIALDHSLTGPVTVSIVAYSEKNQPIGYGTSVQQHIVIGGQTIIPVTITESEPPGQGDGGAPDGGGSDGGAPGDAGDGAAGQDGADATGLDTGTD
jgi:hypothetical protein